MLKWAKKATLAYNADFQMVNLTLGQRNITATVPVPHISSPPESDKTFREKYWNHIRPSVCSTKSLCREVSGKIKSKN